MPRSWLPSFAAVVVIVAGSLAACGRHDQPADPPADPSQILQAGGGRSWYRGNLHTHTLWSDGDALPDTVVAWYRDNGYQFLALTEHDLVADAERWIDVSRLNDIDTGPAALRRLHLDGAGPREHGQRSEVRLLRHDELAARHSVAGEFLLLQGEEISDNVGSISVHVNAVNIPSAVPPARLDDVNRTIEADFVAASQLEQADREAMLLQLNHPNFVYSITAEHLMRLHGSQFFEVYNGHPLSNNMGDGLHPSTERMWDIALAWRLDVLGLPPLYATATDDSHNYGALSDASPGRGWVSVLAEALEAGPLFEAMRGGRFYASTGIRLEKVVATADRLEVHVDPAPGVSHVIEFIGTRTGFDATALPALSATGRPLYASRRYDEEIGRVLSRHQGNRAVYRFEPEDLYVRARITSSRRHPDPSQPLQYEQAWVQPHVGPAGLQPRRPGLAPPPAALPSLHRDVTQVFQPLSQADGLLQPALPRMACSLDLTSDARGRPSTALARNQSMQFAGWLAIADSGTVPGSLAVVLEGRHHAYVGEGGTGRYRPDVAEVFGRPGLEASGFHLGFSLAEIPPGEYRVRLIGFHDGRPLACDTGTSIGVL